MNVMVDKNNIIREIIERYYEGNYTESEQDGVREAFMHWFDNGHDTEQKRRIIMELWESDKGQQDGSLDSALEHLREAIGSKRELNKSRGIKLNRFLRIAAVVAVVLSVTTAVWHYGFTKDDPVEIAQSAGVNFEVPRGEMQHQILSDGSQVWINSQSTLSFEQNNSDVRLATLTGEAYFSVVRDERKPFVVSVGDLKVTVVGTEFNVTSYPEESTTTVTLFNGKVVLNDSHGDEWQLEPEQQFVYDCESHSVEIKTLTKDELSEMLLWRSGKLVCYGMTINEIFKAIERRYALHIEVSPGVEFNDVRYKIEFEKDDSPQLIMAMLEQLVNKKIDYQIGGDTIRVIKQID